MKKYPYLLMLLFALGALLSALLLIQHYFPESQAISVACGRGLVNPCLSLSQSAWSTLLGMPVAAYGLLFYLLGLFILLVADYAGGRYPGHALALLLPLGAAAVLVDAVLAVILIATSLFCAFCVATYAVSLAILAIAVLWFRRARRDEGFALPAAYREILSTKDASPDRKAFLGSFVLFLFLLAFAVFSTSSILKFRTQEGGPPPEKVQGFLTNFYRMPVENIAFPDSGLAMGSPKAEITIIAFTDFLCSACYEFYKTEKLLFARYPGKVRVIYYNYPLDMGCNPDVKRTVYPNSCIAARAMMAASDAGFLESYIVRHFADYHATKEGYGVQRALDLLGSLEPEARRGTGADAFLARMNAQETSKRLEDHINLAKDSAIDSTPTIFIGGRRIVGVPPIQILDQIIRRELARKRLSE
jgi:protein-disulfide isomerase/uncharacterized membrane protein